MDKVGLGSRTRLGVAAGVPTSTVTGLITGERRASERTMEAVAAALGIEVTTIREWAALARGEQEPYQPPPEANRLDRRTRKAIDELIRAIVAAADEAPEPPPVPDFDTAEGLRLAPEETPAKRPANGPNRAR